MIHWVEYRRSNTGNERPDWPPFLSELNEGVAEVKLRQE